MVSVTETKKLTKLDFNGKEIVVNSEDTVVWNRIKVEDDGSEITVNEGDTIQFTTDSGELKNGIVAKISGKKEKTKIKIAFEDGHDETWSICSIQDNSLKNLNAQDAESEE